MRSATDPLTGQKQRSRTAGFSALTPPSLAAFKSSQHARFILQFFNEASGNLLRISLQELGLRALHRQIDFRDLLPRREVSRAQPQVRRSQLLDGLVLGRHDALERRIAGLVDT